MTETGSINPRWGPDWDDVRSHWSLDPDVSHLNHGSYGAVPICVREVQNSFRAEVDRNPEKWFRRRLSDEAVKARAALTRFCGAPTDAIALVPNVSTGISTVLANLELTPGDEILLTNHAYRAVRFAVERKCAEAGSVLATADIMAGATAEEILAAFNSAITDRTRLVIVDHISSDTAMLFPVADIVTLMRSRKIPVLVDGAHACGMVSLDLAGLDPDFWVGNLHKWCCAPHGTAVLYVSERFRSELRALTVGIQYRAGFPRNFDYTGTTDFTSWLAAPAALTLLGSIGWERIRGYNNSLCEVAQRVVAAELRTPECDIWGDCMLSMRVVPLPKTLVSDNEEAKALQTRLANEFGFETMIKTWGHLGLIRLSTHVYNTLREYERLAHVLGRLAS